MLAEADILNISRDIFNLWIAIWTAFAKTIHFYNLFYVYLVERIWCTCTIIWYILLHWCTVITLNKCCGQSLRVCYKLLDKHSCQILLSLVYILQNYCQNKNDDIFYDSKRRYSQNLKYIWCRCISGTWLQDCSITAGINATVSRASNSMLSGGPLCAF